MDAQLTSSSAVLDELWDEFVADEAGLQAAAAEKQSMLLKKAQDRMRSAPADLLNALGLDVATAVWESESGGRAHVEGACVLQGQRLETALWAEASDNGRVLIEVEGNSTNALAPDVRWAVRKLLGLAMRSRESDRMLLVQRLRKRAAEWSLNSEDLAGRRLTLAALPFVREDELAEVRRTVARRKWAARRERHAARRERAAREAAQRERARGLWAALQEWQRANDEFKAEALAWASKWAALLDERYGETELWEVTFGARGEGRVQADEDAPSLWLTAVVLEAPGDLAVGAHGLTHVTAVTAAGQTEERWIGPVAQIRRLHGMPQTVTAGAPYHRAVWCGGYVVNVPPVASDNVRPERDMPEYPASLRAWLEAEGFEREAGMVVWEIRDGAEVSEELALNVVVQKWK